MPNLQGVDLIIHLGDLVDKRTSISPITAKRLHEDFLDPLDKLKIPVVFIAGNHDVNYKSTNDVNWLDILLKDRYFNFHRFSEATEYYTEEETLLLVPWINSGNEARTFEKIAASNARYAFGHLELAGHRFDKHTIATHGYDSDLFANFDRVFTGHFHEPSVSKNVHYIGAPYEMTFADSGCDRGFRIFDTVTGEISFYKNPHQMFLETDLETLAGYSETAYNIFNARYVRVNIPDKQMSNDESMDVVLSKLLAAKPINVRKSITRGRDASNDGEVSIETINVRGGFSIFEDFIGRLNTSVDKDTLLETAKKFYDEARQTL